MPTYSPFRGFVACSCRLVSCPNDLRKDRLEKELIGRIQLLDSLNRTRGETLTLSLASDRAAALSITPREATRHGDKFS